MNQVNKEHAAHSHRLKAISFTGGFLDGISMEFASGLSCLIGPRGTGKTTVVELIRYALEEFRGDESGELRRRVESLVQANLGGGRISLVVETADGIEYQVSRTALESPIALTTDGEHTDIVLGSTNVFRADIFSQNEVETIAGDSLSQLALLDSFIAGSIAEINERIQSTLGELRTNGVALADTRARLSVAEDALGEMPAIEEKLRKLAAVGGGSADEVNKAHAEKALRDRESKAVADTLDVLRQEYGGTSGFAARVPRQITAFAPDMLAGPNQRMLQTIVTALGECSERINAAVAMVRDALERAGGAVSAAHKELNTAHQKQEATFRQLIEKHQAAQAQSAERVKLERKRNDLLAHKATREVLTSSIAELEQLREASLARLSELRDQRFQQRKAQADRITASLKPTIRVRVEQFANRDAYMQLIEWALEGARVSRKAVAQKLADSVSPAELSVIITARDRDALIDQAGLNANQADCTLSALAEHSMLHDLETVELIDQPWIELQDGEQYKDALMLSTGQKCTAILPILLLDSPNPLIIDQPEDNLDNSFIYETVVKTIREVKTHRQMIFVTHNPNIPVLGDAERVIVLQSDGRQASLAPSGTVDECKDAIVKLLEGGEEAFLRRKKRYNY